MSRVLSERQRESGDDGLAWDGLHHLVGHVAAAENHALNHCADRWNVVLDHDGNFAYLSRYYYEKMGFSKEEIIGRPFLDFTIAEVRSRERAEFHEAFDARAPLTKFSFKRARSGGSTVVVSASGTPQFDRLGTFLGYWVVSEDVTAIVNSILSSFIIDVFDNCPLGVTLTEIETPTMGDISAETRYSNKSIAATVDNTQPDATFDQFRTCFDAMLPDLLPLDREEVDWSSSAGRPLWLEMTSQEISIQDRDYTLVWHADVTERNIRAAELEQANEQLHTLSTTDGLTGLGNRRQFDITWADEWNRLESFNTPLALLMVDLDNFKQFNDRYGHGEGDRCLREVAQVIRSLTRRAEDFAARYGGEEFALIISGPKGLQAKSHAEALRRRVQALQIPHAEAPQRVVTISVGVAVTSQPGAMAQDTFFKMADDALYKAKQAGRNRICVAGEVL